MPKNHLTEDGGNRLTFVGPADRKPPATVELALVAGIWRSDFPVPYVAPYARRVTSRCAAPDKSFGASRPERPGARPPQHGGGAYVFSANGGTNDVSVIDVARALSRSTRAEILAFRCRWPMGSPRPQRRHIIVERRGQRDGSAGTRSACRCRPGNFRARPAPKWRVVLVGTDDASEQTHPLIPSVTPDGREVVVPNVRAGNVSIVNIEQALAGNPDAEVARIPLARPDGQAARPKGSAITSDGRYAVISGGPSSPPFSQELGHLYLDATFARAASSQGQAWATSLMPLPSCSDSRQSCWVALRL